MAVTDRLRKEDVQRPNLVISREPEATKPADGSKTVGDQALQDALILVVIAWVILILLFVSLRRHNI